MVSAKFREGFRRHLALEIELHIGELVDLQQAPITHAAPGGKARQFAFPSHAATGLTTRVRERDPVPPLPKGTGGLKAGGACADNQYVFVFSCGPDALGVPASAPFLSHGRVLGA